MQMPFELNNLLLAITVAVTAMIASENTQRRKKRLTESTQSVGQLVKADTILQKEIVDRVKPLTAEFTKQTKHALFTAHYKYLSKPYKHMPAKAHQLKIRQGIIANRRNHGILHTIRTTAYIQAILHESILAKKITAVQKKSMQQQPTIAAYFDITGREDESGLKSNSVRYKASRVTAANNF